MKAPSLKSRREIIFLLGISLLVLSPVLYLWLKSVISSPPTARVIRKSIIKGNGMSSTAFLSPDGRLIAHRELGGLVIRTTQTGKEFFRSRSEGKFIGWIPQSNNFVIQDDVYITIFSILPRNPGVPASTIPYIATYLSFAENSSGFSSSPSIVDTSASELQTGYIAFSPDLRFAVKGSWDKGDIWWQVADLVTGKMAPRIKMGHWLAYDPHVGGFSNDISISVAPANLASGGLPLVSVIQKDFNDPSLNPTPTPVPTVTPIPAPTPTFSPDQTQFLKKAATEEAAIQDLAESVLGVDGAEPTVTDESEIARIEAEVKQRNKDLEVERARFFPPLIPKTQPTPQTKWDGTEPFQIESFDLSQRKRLWSSKVKGQVFMPKMNFSPDGAGIVVWGVSPTPKAGKSQVFNGNDSEFELRDPRTGQIRAKLRLFEDILGALDDYIPFYSAIAVKDKGTPHSILTLMDSVSYQTKATGSKNWIYGRNKVLRFFDVAKAREIGYLKIDPKWLQTDFGKQIRTISPDNTGQLWLLGNSDYGLITRLELGKEFSSPLPTPTPN